MGQKVNPIGFRLGINRTWDSRWYANKKDYARLLHEDFKIRDRLFGALKQAAVSKIIIERPHAKCRVIIHSARPGVVIGKKGADIERLRRLVAAQTNADVIIDIVEVRKPEMDAALVAQSVAQQLERRIAFRRAMKRAVQSAMKVGAGGIRINCSGRLGGSEIARMEWYREGRVPLQTIRADIDYGIATAFTTYGTCGVKVWIFKGEVHERNLAAETKPERQSAAAPQRENEHRSPSKRTAPPPENAFSPTSRGNIPPINATLTPASDFSQAAPPPGEVKETTPAEPEAAGDPLPEDWPEQAERELMQAFGALSAGGVEKRKAIDALLRQGRQAMRAHTIPRALSKRLSAIIPSLFEKLFDPEIEVRWAAAYAIVALRRPKKFTDVTAPTPATTEVENAVLNELQLYLRERGSSLITEVEISNISRSEDALDLSGKVKIFDQIPLELAHGRLRLAKQPSDSGKHVLEVEISEKTGRIIAEYEAKSEVSEDPTKPLAERDFQVHLDPKTTDSILVKINFDNRRLRTHEVGLRNLVKSES